MENLCRTRTCATPSRFPFGREPGLIHSVKVRMDFRDPTIAGTFVFHCHILLHEDLGMMHKILVLPN